jgi:hypothetical protein
MYSWCSHHWEGLRVRQSQWLMVVSVLYCRAGFVIEDMLSHYYDCLIDFQRVTETAYGMQVRICMGDLQEDEDTPFTGNGLCIRHILWQLLSLMFSKCTAISKVNGTEIRCGCSV